MELPKKAYFRDNILRITKASVFKHTELGNEVEKYFIFREY